MKSLRSAGLLAIVGGASPASAVPRELQWQGPEWDAGTSSSWSFAGESVRWTSTNPRGPSESVLLAAGTAPREIKLKNDASIWRLTVRGDGYSIVAASPKVIHLSGERDSLGQVLLAEKTSTKIGKNVSLRRGQTSSAEITISGGGELVVEGAIEQWAPNNLLLAEGARLRVAAGGRVKAGNSLVVGSAGSGSVELIVDGGDVSVAQKDASLILSNATRVACSSRIVLRSGRIEAIGQGGGVRFGNKVPANDPQTRVDAEMVLEGGTLVASKIYQVPYSGAARFDSRLCFDGGLLRASGTAEGNFLSGLGLALVRRGGARIDTNGQDITIGQSLMEDAGSPGGGLIKLGEGRLSLTGRCRFTGPLEVQRGSVEMGVGGILDNRTELSVRRGAAFRNFGSPISEKVCKVETGAMLGGSSPIIAEELVITSDLTDGMRTVELGSNVSRDGVLRIVLKNPAPGSHRLFAGPEPDRFPKSVWIDDHELANKGSGVFEGTQAGLRYQFDAGFGILTINSR